MDRLRLRLPDKLRRNGKAKIDGHSGAAPGDDLPILTHIALAELCTIKLLLHAGEAGRLLPLQKALMAQNRGRCADSGNQLAI